MALILGNTFRYAHFLFTEYKDPRVENYPLLGSPVPVLIIMGLYLLFVLKWGPEWMKNRKPYDLKNVISVYNAFQVIVNSMIFVYGMTNSYFKEDFSLTCQPIDSTANSPWMQNLLKATFGYYLTKYLDLLDTVFFVLRKKNNQITFLHVYHHAGMLFAAYIFTKFLGGSHPTLIGIINTAVHVFMYSYYFLTAYKPELRDQIWWKKQITRLQLLQFAYLIIHFVIPIVNNVCQFPIFIAFILLVQNLFMLTLFADFYLKAYSGK